jgi:hypothetical protein
VQSESIELARLLQDDGAVDALQLTGGGPLLNPMFLFRGDPPPQEFARTLPPVLRPGFRLMAARFMRTTRSRRRTSCRWHGSSGRRWTCR